MRQTARGLSPGRRWKGLSVLLVLALSAPGVADAEGWVDVGEAEFEQADLEHVATFATQTVHGLAVDESGERVFVVLTQLSGEGHRSRLGMIDEAGEFRLYPGEVLKEAVENDSAGQEAALELVRGRGVTIDQADGLWVLDAGDEEHPARLIRVSLTEEAVDRVIEFDRDVAPERSILSGLCVDVEREVAYISDAGLGALVLVDLANDEARRVLNAHEAVRARPVQMQIGGRRIENPERLRYNVHVNGLALSPGGEFLYFRPLLGYHLYRIPARALWQLRDRPELLSAAVEDLGPDVISDGMSMDSEQRLYMAALEHDAVVRRSGRGELEAVVQDRSLRWASQVALSQAGWLYVATSPPEAMMRPEAQRKNGPAESVLYRVRLED